MEDVIQTSSNEAVLHDVLLSMARIAPIGSESNADAAVWVVRISSCLAFPEFWT